jgi:hypothetical protein
VNKPAAIYARVSSDRQKENQTIGSQTAALIEYAQTHGYAVPPEWVFQDEPVVAPVHLRNTGHDVSTEPLWPGSGGIGLWDSCGLHGHMRDALLFQPRAEPQKVIGEAPNRPS